MKKLDIPSDVRWAGVERETKTEPVGNFGSCSGIRPNRLHMHLWLPIETAYFKTVFELTGPAEKAMLRISANTRYCLFVNGEEILRGPCKNDHWHQYCDGVELTPYMKEGKNVVAVKVTAFPPFEATSADGVNKGPIWTMGNAAGPMLIVYGEIKTKAETIDLSTGKAEWYYKNDDAISWVMQHDAHWMGCTEDADGGKLPHFWQSDKSLEGFEKAPLKWNNEVRYGEIPRLFLYERPIKYLLRKPIDDLGEIINVSGNEIYETVLDAGRLTTALVYLKCSGGKGAKISLLYSEAYTKKNSGGHRFKGRRDDSEGELIGVSDIYRSGGGDETYSPSWFRCFRFIKITVETKGEPLIIYP
jgi:hypothetical protein